MYEATSIHRKATIPDTSSTSPIRPMGVLLSIALTFSSSASTEATRGVRMYHGHTAFTEELSRVVRNAEKKLYFYMGNFI